MRMADDFPRYRLPAQIFHWVTAIFVLTAIPLGFMMLEADPGPRQNQLYDLHRSFGFVIWLVVLGRVAYRIAHPPPPMVPMPRWQAHAADGLHKVLYLFLLTMPLIGWAGTSAFGARISIFGLFQLPIILEKNEALSKVLLTIHGGMGFILAVLVTGHIGAALFHHFVRKDPTLLRMIPKA
jgi:cytochrome b561